MVMDNIALTDNMYACKCCGYNTKQVANILYHAANPKKECNNSWSLSIKKPMTIKRVLKNQRL
jgi:hypothetical protein